MEICPFEETRPGFEKLGRVFALAPRTSRCNLTVVKIQRNSAGFFEKLGRVFLLELLLIFFMQNSAGFLQTPPSFAFCAGELYFAASLFMNSKKYYSY